MRRRKIISRLYDDLNRRFSREHLDSDFRILEIYLMAASIGANDLLANSVPGENESKPNWEPEQTLVAILQSLPGAGKIVLTSAALGSFRNPAAGRLRRLTHPVRRGPLGHRQTATGEIWTRLE
jgi:hypothetical protein